MNAFLTTSALTLFALAACDSRPAPAPPPATPPPPPVAVAPSVPAAAPAAPAKPAAPAPVVTAPAAPRPAAPDAAIARFQQSMDAFHKWVRSNEGSASPDMANAGALMKEVTAQLGRIPTAGLPAGLRDAFTEYRNALLGVQNLVATIPASGGNAVEKWERENAEAFGTLNKRMEAAVANLRRVAAAHGIPDLKVGD